MASPFLKVILSWRNLSVERRESRRRSSSNRLSRSKSSSSDASDSSDHTNELTSQLKQSNEDTWSPSFRTMRRHAICEENLREYYTFWCVNNNHSCNEETNPDHNHHNYNNNRHQHHNRQHDERQTLEFQKKLD